MNGSTIDRALRMFDNLNSFLLAEDEYTDAQLDTLLDEIEEVTNLLKEERK